MSAYVVSREHIDALVAVAVFGPSGEAVNPGTSWYGVHDPDTQERMRYDEADRIGTELWSENVRSVAYRYPQDGSGDRPGPANFTDDQAFEYVFPMTTRRVSAIAGLKAIDGLEYQSCEHPEWETSWSARFLDGLRRQLIGHLPGYNDAAWEIQHA